MPIGIYKYVREFRPSNLPPLPPQKSKADVKLEAYEQYLENLPLHCNETLTLVSETVSAEFIKRMRVRGSKPGQGKKSTHIDMLAKGTRTIDKDGVEHIRKNNDFGKYHEQPYKNMAMNTSLEDLNANWKNRESLWRICRNAKRNIATLKIMPLYVKKDLNSGGFVYTEHIAQVKQLTRLKSHAFISIAAMDKPNSLLRQILLFKGIGFGQVEQDIRENKMKPVTYNVNTRIEYDRDNTNKAHLISVMKVHSITVKKTFRNTVGDEEQCNMFFSSENCRVINAWKGTIL